MIRHSEFPAEATAVLTKRLLDAGDGARLRILWVATKDGTGMRPMLAVRTAAELAAKTPDEECEEPINDSYVCPPIC